MQIDDTLLTKLENLSNLKISDDKREEVISQLSEIVAFVDNLSELDTSGVDDTFAMTNNATPLREDSPSSNQQITDDILRHAPKAENDLFIVPKIIE